MYPPFSTYAPHFSPLPIFLHFDLLRPLLSCCLSPPFSSIICTLIHILFLRRSPSHSGRCKILQLYLHLMLNGWAERRYSVPSLLLASEIGKICFKITLLFKKTILYYQLLMENSSITYLTGTLISNHTVVTFYELQGGITDATETLQSSWKTARHMKWLMWCVQMGSCL